MNDWVSEAAALPIAFAQVREDPRLDLACCRRRLPENATVVMIASGGDTAVCLARLPLARLILVDMNPAQLALTRCKLHLAKHAERKQALAWLGHSFLPVPEEQLTSLFAEVGLPMDALGRLGVVAANGPDFSGRYEFLFAALRARLREQPETAFEDVMSMGNLVALFGKEATQNPRVPFAQHFSQRLADAFARQASGENPFLSQMLYGCFPAGVAWDWLSEESWTPLCVEPEFVQARMHDALEALPAESVDFVQLSNILDWLSPAEATELLRSAHRVLKPGGLALIRQLNSSLDIPNLASGFHWEVEAGRGMVLCDRSFFYPEIHLGRKG